MRILVAMKLKPENSIEALFAFIFAICVLVALLLLGACHAIEAPAPEAHPAVPRDAHSRPVGERVRAVLASAPVVQSAQQ